MAWKFRYRLAAFVLSASCITAGCGTTSPISSVAPSGLPTNTVVSGGADRFSILAADVPPTERIDVMAKDHSGRGDAENRHNDSHGVEANGRLTAINGT